MSRLDELIAELCPDGVTFKPIKEVYQRLKGTPITAGKMKEIDTPDGEIKVFAGGKTVITAHEEDISKANITRVPAVLVQSRGVIDVVYYDEPFTFKNEMWAYTHDKQVSVKYLYYVLKNNINTFREAASGMGSLPQISLKVTEDFVIPVPPLEVQREIVRILDNFTELTAELQTELQAELQARKKQYEYYKNLFLNESDSNIVPLKQITNKVYSGKNKKRIDGGPYPVYGSTGVISYTDIDVNQKPQILIARVGANAGYVHIAEGKYDVSDNTLIVDLKDGVNLRYVYYQLGAINLNQYAKGGGQPLITAGQVKEISFPVPCIEKQNQIVKKNDRFFIIYNDLNFGLLEEIEARQKQYEYYRDKLLTFKPLS